MASERKQQSSWQDGSAQLKGEAWPTGAQPEEGPGRKGRLQPARPHPTGALRPTADVACEEGANGGANGAHAVDDGGHGGQSLLVACST
jgi:hypothetical protein